MRLKPLPILLTLVVVILLVAILFVTISYFRYTSESAVLNYLGSHSGDVAIACMDPAAPENGFYHNADEPYPLASTFKLLLLAAYADEVAAGRLDPQETIQVSDLAVYYLPNTDGGAHPQFLQSLGEGQTTLTLDQAVDGMIVYSSNAAADYVHARLGDYDFPALYRRLGLQQTDAPFSYLGLYLFMSNHDTGQYAQEDISREQAYAEQARLAELFTSNAEWRAAEVAFVGKMENFAPVDIQTEVVNAYGMRGSARDMARVMLAAYGYNAEIAPATQAILRQHLEWPMRLNPDNEKEFRVLATKGGAWPGILTSAWYAEPLQGKTPLTLSVLYRNMPDDFWSAWLVSFSQQVLEARVLAEADCSILSDAVR